MKVGGAKQEGGALAGLDVLERRVVARLAAGKGMSEILKHLPACRTNVDLFARHFESLH